MAPGVPSGDQQGRSQWRPAHPRGEPHPAAMAHPSRTRSSRAIPAGGRATSAEEFIHHLETAVASTLDMMQNLEVMAILVRHPLRRQRPDGARQRATVHRLGRTKLGLYFGGGMPHQNKNFLDPLRCAARPSAFYVWSQTNQRRSSYNETRVSISSSGVGTGGIPRRRRASRSGSSSSR